MGPIAHAHAEELDKLYDRYNRLHYKPAPQLRGRSHQYRGGQQERVSLHSAARHSIALPGEAYFGDCGRVLNIVEERASSS